MFLPIISPYGTWEVSYAWLVWDILWVEKNRTPFLTVSLVTVYVILVIAIVHHKSYLRHEH